MDWMTMLDFASQIGIAAAPILASAVMLLVGVLFYRLTGLLPGFMRARIEALYREKEALMREAITRALVNGITTAVNRGKRGRDALQDAVDHAMKTNPDAVAHFSATSNMTPDTLSVMAERAAVDLDLKLEADAVVVNAEGQG